jgi:colicin import membrane protein
MKYRISFILLFSILLSQTSFSQSKKELEAELKATKSKLDSIQILYYQQQNQYQQRISSLEATIDKIKFVIDNNNKAISNNGNQVSTGVNGSPTIQDGANPKQVVLGEGDGLTPRTGATIYTGSRGGQYYINKNGNKTYIRRKKG